MTKLLFILLLLFGCNSDITGGDGGGGDGNGDGPINIQQFQNHRDLEMVLTIEMV